MKNLVSRLLLFFTVVPAVLITLIYFDFYNNLICAIIIVAFSTGCAWELAGLFNAKGIKVNAPLFTLIGAGVPIVAYLLKLFSPFPGGNDWLSIIFPLVPLLMTFSFVRYAFVRTDFEIGSVLEQAAAHALVFFYPGLLAAFIVLIAALPAGSEALMIFCIVTFSNDTVAWLFGMTLGRKRGVFPVSPNKSVIGFVGGIVGSIGAALHCGYFFKGVITDNVYLLVAFGLVMGVAGIVGDLFESALKRSAHVKDSGAAVPGRGGFLDSFDNQLFTAPLAYFFMTVLGVMTGGGN